jgi:hypothetical protein
MACVRLIGLPQDCVHLRDSSGGSVAKFCPRQSYREFRPFSGGDVEQGIDEGGLGDDVVPTNPLHLPFSHHRQSFIANQGAPRGPEPLEAEARPDQPLYSPVILLDDVVKVLDLPQFGGICSWNHLAWLS